MDNLWVKANGICLHPQYPVIQQIRLGGEGVKDFCKVLYRGTRARTREEGRMMLQFSENRRKREYLRKRSTHEKAKRCPIQTGKNIASPLSFTTYLYVSSKSLRLYLLSKYKQLKASGKWTFPLLTPESLRQKLKSLRRDEIASGKMTFSVGNIKLPQAKRHFQLETANCLRQNDISSEK